MLSNQYIFFKGVFSFQNCRSIGHSIQNCQNLVNCNPIVQKNLTKAFSNAITKKKSSHPMLDVTAKETDVSLVNDVNHVVINLEDQ